MEECSLRWWEVTVIVVTIMTFFYMGFYMGRAAEKIEQEERELAHD